jgi:lysozyme family protein
MASFKIAHNRRLGIEGKYSGDPLDNGNWTGGKKGVGVLVGSNLGVSAPVLAKHLGRAITVDDMKNLSHETAEAIYRKNYWNPIRGDEIEFQDVANSIYDSAVNMGVSAAIKLTQRSLGIPESVKMTDEIINLLNNKV